MDLLLLGRGWSGLGHNDVDVLGGVVVSVLGLSSHHHHSSPSSSDDTGDDAANDEEPAEGPPEPDKVGTTAITGVVAADIAITAVGVAVEVRGAVDTVAPQVVVCTVVTHDAREGCRSNINYQLYLVCQYEPT